MDKELIIRILVLPTGGEFSPFSWVCQSACVLFGFFVRLSAGHLHGETNMSPTRTDLNREAGELRSKLLVAKREIDRVIVGMDSEKDSFLISLIAGGHYIIEGVPGLAKTKLMKAAARVCGLSFGRVQSNSGLTSDDVLGQYLPTHGSEGRGGLEFFRGPIFKQIVLWDEANRMLPKTQAALLEGMEEFSVTTAYGEYFELPNPFMVCATLNPREISSGTSPLTDANLDRFLLSQWVDYPLERDEHEMVSQDDAEPLVSGLEVKLGQQDILQIRSLVKELFPMDHAARTVDFATKLARITRPHEDPSREIKTPGGESCRYGELVLRGISPRATKLLARAARADAFLRGEELSPKHIGNVAIRVMRHRIVLSPMAEPEGVTAEYLIDYLLRYFVPVTGDPYHV